MARLRRDDALERISGVTKSIGIGIAVAVAALGFYVSKALPGHHATTSGASNTGSAAQTSSGTASAPQSSINPPSTPTQNTVAPAPVTSGAT